MGGRPALSSTLPAVIHSGDYFLFESDSEEEEEEAQPEDPRPSAQSAFQVRWECLLPAFPSVELQGSPGSPAPTPIETPKSTRQVGSHMPFCPLPPGS